MVVVSFLRLTRTRGTSCVPTYEYVSKFLGFKIFSFSGTTFSWCSR